MCTRISVAVAVVLLVCSVVGAQTVLPGSVWQYQDFAVGNLMNPGMSSILNLVHGDGSAHVLQTMDVENVHASPQYMNPCSPCGPCGSIGIISVGTPVQICGADCLTMAGQCQTAGLYQEGAADGACAIIGVNAFLDAGGAQEQTIGASTQPKSQGQSLGMAADQVLFRSDGAGGGWANNQANLFQVQTGKNSAGSVRESSTIDTWQTSAVNGAANSTATLATSMNACTTQAQVVY